MTAAEFIIFSFDHWLNILLWSILIITFLYFIFRKLVPGKFYDPFHLYVAFNLGTSYAVVLSLFQFGYISNRLFAIILFYALILFGFLYFFFKKKFSIIQLNNFFRAILTPKSSCNIEIFFIILIYICLSFFLISTSGLAAFTDTNRFEQAKGLGAFVRVLDLFRLIIIAYFSIFIFNKKTKGNGNKISHYVSIFFLLTFVVFSSLQNGAKFALFESLFTILIALKAYNIPIKLNFYKISLIVVVSTIFALVILSLNLKSNDQSDVSLYSESSSPLIDRFIFRILSNGDMYYLSLPNEVIDKIEKDNVIVRIGAQIFGNTPLSNFLGYDVSKYSVGKSILLYHNPNFELAGGPVSHIDLFSYIYLGNFGYLFTILIAFLIFSISNSITSDNNSMYYSAIISSMWLRSMAIFIEPPVGIAYVFDIIIIIFSINILGFFLRKLIK